MSGHTPGPWQIEGQARGGILISAGINEYRDGPAAYVAAVLPHSPSAESMRTADLALILAAPDLLAAAKAVLAMAGFSPYRRLSQFRDLQAAVDKAGGQ